MKATAWPALVIAFALVFVRDGKRVAWRFAAVAVSVVSSSWARSPCSSPARW
jgi:hypothetical protein